MKATEFWSYVNTEMSHLLLPSSRCAHLRDFLKWVGSVDLMDYTEARKAFDSICWGR